MYWDNSGISTTPKGTEIWEHYTSTITGKKYYQYDLRTKDGALYSVVGETLDACREKVSKQMAAAKTKTSVCRTSVTFHPEEVGGVFDGVSVHSDADPGL